MTRKLTTTEFIAQATLVHGDRWDYSGTDYDGQRKPVKIFCQTHGAFLQTPSAHVSQGQGCPSCGNIKSGKSRVCTQGHFLDRLSADYKKTYDLSSTDYQGLYAPVVVRCAHHGEFNVKPCDMYKNVGCPHCSSSGFKSDKPAHLYVLKALDGTVKLGITNNRPVDRARRVSASSGKEHSVVHVVSYARGLAAQRMEATLLQYLRENYDSPREVYDGYTESFVGLEVNALIELIESIRGKE